jgi:hypothetical protein
VYKVIRIQGRQVKFPPVCVICFQTSKKVFDLERTFTYGRRSILINLAVPMCEEHFNLASTKSKGEKLIARAGLIVGILTGLLAAGGLAVYWFTTNQGSAFLNILIASFIGLGFFLIVWAASAFWLAPVFAATEIKAIRNAVRIKNYWPASDVLELEFASGETAALFIRENLPFVV